MQVHHRLIIRHPHDDAILVAVVGAEFALPSFDAADQHTAEVDYINAAALESFGLTTTVLRSLSHSDPYNPPIVRVHELLAHGHDHNRQGRLRWVNDETHLTSASDRAAFASWRASADHDREPWEDPHWFDAACLWIRQALTDAALGPANTIVQLRVWPSSYVLHVQTAAGEFYFKALPTSGELEYRVSRYLAEHFQRALPRIVAYESERRWLLLEACDGHKLEGSTDPTAWERAAAQYGCLQVDCVDHVSALRALGCAVHDLETLARKIEPLCNDPAALQLGEPDGLSAAEIERLQSLVPELRRNCEELDAAGIALTLEHGDLWPGNIFIGATSCTIIDWEDIMIAHPFFSLAPLRVGLTYSAASSPGLLSRLESAYLSAFSSFGPADQLLKTSRIAAPLGFIDMAIRYRHERPSVVALHPWMRGLVPETLRLALQSVVPRS